MNETLFEVLPEDLTDSDLVEVREPTSWPRWSPLYGTTVTYWQVIRGYYHCIGDGGRFNGHRWVGGDGQRCTNCGYERPPKRQTRLERIAELEAEVARWRAVVATLLRTEDPDAVLVTTIWALDDAMREQAARSAR